MIGIHYDPLVSWDGEDRDPNGYCAHQKVTFPTWHRPYVVLYEVSVLDAHLFGGVLT